MRIHSDHLTENDIYRALSATSRPRTAEWYRSFAKLAPARAMVSA